MERFRHWCDTAKKKWEPVLWVLGVAVAFIVAQWFILGPRVEEAAKRVVLSKEVLSDISSRLRPYAVIDATLNNTPTIFEYDQGVGDIVDSVEFRLGESKFKGVLTFKMKKFVPVAPVVKPLTAGVYVHSFWRTNKFDWAYEIRSGWVTVGVPGANGEIATGGIDDLSKETDYRFFVELLTK